MNDTLGLRTFPESICRLSFAHQGSTGGADTQALWSRKMLHWPVHRADLTPLFQTVHRRLAKIVMANAERQAE